jgi:hypothetical protein
MKTQTQKSNTIDNEEFYILVELTIPNTYFTAMELAYFFWYG